MEKHGKAYCICYKYSALLLNFFVTFQQGLSDLICTLYSGTCSSDHLYKATTSLLWPLPVVLNDPLTFSATCIVRPLYHEHTLDVCINTNTLYSMYILNA